MVATTSEFLEKVFKIQRMNEWRFDHPEQWQQLSDWAGSGTPDSSKLNDNQRKWLKYLERTGPGSTDPFDREGGRADGYVKIQDYPPFGNLSDKDWEELYKICKSAWYQMKHDKGAYAGYKDSVKQFITNNAHFFDDVAEEAMTAQPQTEAAITAMVDLLEKVTDSYVLSTLGISSSEMLELRRKVTDRKYNTDPEFRKKITEISSKIVNADDSTKRALDRIVQREFAPATKLEEYVRSQNLEIISNEYYGWIAQVNTVAKVNEFKTNYFDFLKPIYNDEDVFKAFDAKEGGAKPITTAINKAKKDIDYNDKNSKNYIPPKREDKLSLVEQIEKWAGDTYSDYFKKYEGLRGAKILHHPSEVNAIVKQIDKAKIKPTDGLEKVISNADGIKRALAGTNPYAADAFGWLSDALKDFQADPNMSHIMKGALKNGRQMNKLVAELIERAAEDGKPETVRKAEIALELLTVIKYGYTTNKVMDAIKEDKELFNILSNKDLSWNKNEGVKFVTTAIDKTVRAAFMGVGYATTILVNRARRRGTKFNGHLPNEKMRQAYRDWQAKNTADKAAAQADHDADNAAAPIGLAPDTRSAYKKSQDEAEVKRNNARAGLTGLGYVGGDDEILRNAELDINNVLKPEEYMRQNRVEEYERLISNLSNAQNVYKDLEDLDAEEVAVTGGAFTPEQRIAKLQEIEAQRRKLKEELKGIGNDGKLDLSLFGGRADFDLLNTPGLASHNLETMINYIYGATGYTGYTDAQSDLGDTQNKIYERQQHIDKFRKATKDIEDAEKQIKAREKKFNEWGDKHQDIRWLLTSYWDTLQNPSLTRFGPRRASRIQARNSNLVQDLLAAKRAGYTLS